MSYTLGQKGQRPWTWLQVAEERNHKDCTDGRTWRWKEQWELQGGEEAKQEQALVREMTTQREYQ